VACSLLLAISTAPHSARRAGEHARLCAAGDVSLAWSSCDNIIAADQRHGNVPMATGDTERAAAVGHRPSRRCSFDERASPSGAGVAGSEDVPSRGDAIARPAARVSVQMQRQRAVCPRVGAARRSGHRAHTKRPRFRL